MTQQPPRHHPLTPRRCDLPARSSSRMSPRCRAGQRGVLQVIVGEGGQPISAKCKSCATSGCTICKRGREFVPWTLSQASQISQSFLLDNCGYQVRTPKTEGFPWRKLGVVFRHTDVAWSSLLTPATRVQTGRPCSRRSASGDWRRRASPGLPQLADRPGDDFEDF